jgi:hypothetical protein
VNSQVVEEIVPLLKFFPTKAIAADKDLGPSISEGIKVLDVGKFL